MLGIAGLTATGVYLSERYHVDIRAISKGHSLSVTIMDGCLTAYHTSGVASDIPSQFRLNTEDRSAPYRFYPRTIFWDRFFLPKYHSSAFVDWSLRGDLRSLSTVLWPVPVVISALGLIPLWRGLRELRRSRAHLCVKCGYDTRGLPSGTPCPECGAADRATHAG